MLTSGLNPAALPSSAVALEPKQRLPTPARRGGAPRSEGCGIGFGLPRRPFRRGLFILRSCAGGAILYHAFAYVVRFEVPSAHRDQWQCLQRAVTATGLAEYGVCLH